MGLGTLHPPLPRALRTALVFGLWDGVSPLVGLLLGRYLGRALGPVAGRLGPVVLGAYGLYLIVMALRRPVPEEPDERWILLGLPFSLSFDNMVAGAGLGLAGYPPLLSAAVFGSITALMSLLGLQVGRAMSRVLPIRQDLLGGIVMIGMAVLLSLGY